MQKGNMTFPFQMHSKRKLCKCRIRLFLVTHYFFFLESEWRNICSTPVSSNNSYICLNIKRQPSHFESEQDKAIFSKDNQAEISECLQKEYKSINSENILGSKGLILNLAQEGFVKRPTSLLLNNASKGCGETATEIEKGSFELSKDISNADLYKSLDYLEKQFKNQSLDSEKNANILESVCESFRNWGKDKNILDSLERNPDSVFENPETQESCSQSPDNDCHKLSSRFQDINRQELVSNPSPCEVIF